VRYAEGDSKPLSALSLEEYRRFSPLFDRDVLALDVRASIVARDVPGGTAPARVSEALRTARGRLKEDA
jgi:argininosuccinate lyase